MSDTGKVSENADGAPIAIPPEEPQPSMEEVVTDDVVRTILSDHDPQLELISYDTKLGSQLGDNYMSIMYSVEIKSRSKSDPKDEKNLSIMLKTMPRNAFRQKMINEMFAFEKEAKMYSHVFKDFEKFQQTKGLSLQDSFNAYPKCYSTFVNGTADFLAMEDLKVTGHKMANRRLGLDLDHCQLVLKNLARFHAISAAMFQGDFDAILEKYPYLKERMFRVPEEVDPMHKAYMASVFTSEADNLRKAGYEKEADKIANLYDEDFFEKIRKLAGVKCKFAVICHGDCWTNNMLFTYDASGKPNGHKFLDFQIGRAASRTTDLGYFFYTSIPMDILNERESDLLKIYNDEFQAFSKRLGYVNPELTLDYLQKEMDAFRFYGISMGLMLAPMLSTKTEDVPDMESLDLPDQNDEALGEKAQEFMTAFMQSDQLTAKLLNIANHVDKLQGGKVGYGDF